MLFLLLILIIALLSVGIARLIGWYQPRKYEAKPYKERIHYIPTDRELNVPIEQCPTRPPKKGEYITSEGEIRVRD